MKIKPLFDRVLLETENSDNVTKSGIVLPDNSMEKSDVGIVVAVGDGLDEKMLVKIGDKVLFNKYAGATVKIEDKNYVVIKQIDIIGVYND